MRLLGNADRAQSDEGQEGRGQTGVPEQHGNKRLRDRELGSVEERHEKGKVRLRNSHFTCFLCKERGQSTMV